MFDAGSGTAEVTEIGILVGRVEVGGGTADVTGMELEAETG